MLCSCTSCLTVCTSRLSTRCSGAQVFPTELAASLYQLVVHVFYNGYQLPCLVCLLFCARLSVYALFSCTSCLISWLHPYTSWLSTCFAFLHQLSCLGCFLFCTRLVVYMLLSCTSCPASVFELLLQVPCWCTYLSIYSSWLCTSFVLDLLLFVPVAQVIILSWLPLVNYFLPSYYLPQ